MAATSPDLDGILLCSDLPNDADSFVSPKIDFGACNLSSRLSWSTVYYCNTHSLSLSLHGADYARRLLRFQLQGLIVQDFSVRDVQVPAIQYAGKMPVGSFAIKRQWLSPASIQYFLTCVPTFSVGYPPVPHQRTSLRSLSTLSRLWCAHARGSRASGFIGVGFAFRPSRSHFWAMFSRDNGATSAPPHQQYSYRGFDASSKVAALTARIPPWADDGKDLDETSTTTEVKEAEFVNGFISSDSSRRGDASADLEWGEPLASIASDDEDADAQGISFPSTWSFVVSAARETSRQCETDTAWRVIERLPTVHRAFFRCAPTLTTSADGESSSVSPQSARDVDIFGEFSGNWDVVLDFNTPCLVLPQQFFDAVRMEQVCVSVLVLFEVGEEDWNVRTHTVLRLWQLTGWLGLQHNDELKLAEIASLGPLPELVFAMALDGPQLSIPLERLVLPELAVTSNASDNGVTRLCIQRSGSILQNGAAMFSSLDQDANTAQRYRVHGALSLPLFNMFQAPVVFGAMVLKAFDEVVVDGDARQVGLQSRGKAAKETTNEQTLASDDDDDDNPTSTAAFATCLRPTACVGQQQFIHRLNACQGTLSSH